MLGKSHCAYNLFSNDSEEKRGCMCRRAKANMAKSKQLVNSNKEKELFIDPFFL